MIFYASLSGPPLNPDRILEIVQGQAASLLFVLEAGLSRFDDPDDPDDMECLIADVEGSVVSKTWSNVNTADFVSITKDDEVQVFRVNLDEDDTAALAPGNVRIELTVDTQKARLSNVLKVIEGITIPSS